MRFEWDERKRQANLAKHGLDFADVREFDWENATWSEDTSESFGELRVRSISRFAANWRLSHGPKERIAFFELSVSGPPLRLRKRSTEMSSERARITPRSREVDVDPDSLPTTREEAKRNRRMSDAAPHVVAAYRKMLGRPPEGDAPKTAVSIRLDRDALAKFKAAGPGWQTRINDLVVKAAAKLKPAKGKAR